jgi:hypothetical protein
MFVRAGYPRSSTLRVAVLREERDEFSGVDVFSVGVCAWGDFAEDAFCEEDCEDVGEGCAGYC